MSERELKRSERVRIANLHELNVVAGALARGAKPKVPQLPDALAKRWRSLAAESDPNPSRQDVIPLLAGWIRRLEREAGADAPIEKQSRR